MATLVHHLRLGNLRMISGLSGSEGDLTVEIETPERALGTSAIRGFWDHQLGGVNPLNRLYASPTWFDHLLRLTKADDLRVAFIRGPFGQVVGVCPIALRDTSLIFSIASRTLARQVLPSAVVLGSEPMLLVSNAHAILFRELFHQLPAIQAIYLEQVPTDSPTWAASRQSIPGILPHFQGRRLSHWIELGTYLEEKSAKARRNLRREARILREHGGTLELRRVVAEAEVDGLVDAALAICARSWQRRVLGQRIDRAIHQPKFRDLARVGMLRSYVLECGGEPCAFLVGYQFEGMFQAIETAFDERLISLSPGAVLFHLVIEDLLAHNAPAALNFGQGDTAYKRRLANREFHDAEVFLLRETVANRLRSYAHSAFHAAGQIARRVVNRRVKKD